MSEGAGAAILFQGAQCENRQFNSYDGSDAGRLHGGGRDRIPVRVTGPAHAAEVWEKTLSETFDTDAAAGKVATKYADKLVLYHDSAK